MAPPKMQGFLATVAAALLILGTSASTAPAWAQVNDDPPGRVGRLSYIEGNVQQRTADDGAWSSAGINFPVTDGFALATDEGSRAEIEVGSMALRVGAASEVDVNMLSDEGTTLTLARGEMNLRLGRLVAGNRIEILTPRGAVDIVEPGQYHIDAGSVDTPTAVAVFNGRAQILRDDAPINLGAGQAAQIAGEGSGGFAMAAAAPDTLDEWALARDGFGGTGAGTALATNSPPEHYISPEMTGAADLTAYGQWSYDPSYGDIWYPNAAPAGWQPYQNGYWTWVSPWGWTWVADEPWGFAPFHYGSWVDTAYGWGWCPGGYIAQPIYAPALVVFIGHDHDFRDHDHRPAVGWFPLAPHERFEPGYHASSGYVRRLNVSRGNDAGANQGRAGDSNSYANHRFVTAMPESAFGHGRSAGNSTIARGSDTGNANLHVAATPGVTPPATLPSHTHIGGANNSSGARAANLPSLPPAHGATGSSANRDAAQHGGTALPPRFSAPVNAGTANAAAAGVQHGQRDAKLTSLPAGQTQNPGAGAASASSNQAPGRRPLPPLPVNHGGTQTGNNASPGQNLGKPQFAVRPNPGPAANIAPGNSSQGAGNRSFPNQATPTHASNPAPVNPPRGMPQFNEPPRQAAQVRVPPPPQAQAHNSGNAGHAAHQTQAPVQQASAPSQVATAPQGTHQAHAEHSNGGNAKSQSTSSGSSGHQGNGSGSGR